PVARIAVTVARSAGCAAIDTAFLPIPVRSGEEYGILRGRRSHAQGRPPPPFSWSARAREFRRSKSSPAGSNGPGSRTTSAFGGSRAPPSPTPRSTGPLERSSGTPEPCRSPHSGRYRVFPIALREPVPAAGRRFRQTLGPHRPLPARARAPPDRKSTRL